MFVAIGHDPRSELFTGQLRLDDEGYLMVEQPSTRTKIPGVFAAVTWWTTPTGRR